MLHSLAATPETVHWGFLDAALPPVLRIESGDTVSIDSISGDVNALPPPGVAVMPEYQAIHAKVKAKLGPHILTGPIWIENAEPGDTLEVRISTSACCRTGATTSFVHSAAPSHRIFRPIAA
jgi:acetamidase/formamidase